MSSNDYTKHKMPPNPNSTADPSHARLQNDYGADYWVRNAEEHRVRTTAHLPYPICHISNNMRIRACIVYRVLIDG
jgi:hypothetical protein